MKSKLKKIIILFIGLFLVLLLNNTLNFNKGVQTELSIPKQSAVSMEPISIDDDATGVGAHNWTWAVSQSWCSGSGTWNDPYIIENIKISGFIYSVGIYICNSNVSFIIQDCLIYNSNDGIYLENVNNSRLINNNCSTNINNGIYLESNCNNNTISGNTANGNYWQYGIYLESNCNNNTISGNTANDNGEIGIYLRLACNNNSIYNNTANGSICGIFLDLYCDYNTISGNTANGNNYHNNYGGILLDAYCDYNTIIDNIFYNNTQGIRIASGCDNNSIYKNFFLENGKHAIDDGTDNTWNSTSIGNYWDNWTSPDVSPNDGIVDDPYTYIGGSAGSIDYLPIAEDGAPSITIISPTSSDVFGVTAPSFDVTITDDYLDEMWYSLDGGLHNYTFNEFTGNIDQTAWDAISNGIITLTFYANDIPGNIGSAEVTVVKDTTGPIIVINSPSTGSEFGVSAPAFIITITDDHLDSVWYSLDGGLTNFVITTNATIDLTAWSALPEGSVTITFYANDTLGHLTFEAVTITKSIPSGGIDPTIIVVIVVVSIVGGVAVIAGVYVFMKKRATPE